MIAVLKSDCFLVSRKSDAIGNKMFCAEACTTQKGAALRNYTFFLGIDCTRASFDSLHQ